MWRISSAAYLQLAMRQRPEAAQGFEATVGAAGELGLTWRPLLCPHIADGSGPTVVHCPSWLRRGENSDMRGGVVSGREVIKDRAREGDLDLAIKVHYDVLLQLITNIGHAASMCSGEKGSYSET